MKHWLRWIVYLDPELHAIMPSQEHCCPADVQAAVVRMCACASLAPAALTQCSLPHQQPPCATPSPSCWEMSLGRAHKELATAYLSGCACASMHACVCYLAHCATCRLYLGLVVLGALHGLVLLPLLLALVGPQKRQQQQQQQQQQW